MYERKTKDVQGRGPSNINLGLFAWPFDVYRASKPFPLLTMMAAAVFEIDHFKFRNFTSHDIKMAARRLSRMIQDNALFYDFQQSEQLRFCEKCLCACLLVH